MTQILNQPIQTKLEKTETQSLLDLIQFQNQRIQSLENVIYGTAKLVNDEKSPWHKHKWTGPNSFLKKFGQEDVYEKINQFSEYFSELDWEEFQKDEEEGGYGGCLSNWIKEQVKEIMAEILNSEDEELEDAKSSFFEKLKDEIRVEMKTMTEKEIKPQWAEKIKTEIKQEVKTEIKSEIKNEIQTDLKLETQKLKKSTLMPKIPEHDKKRKMSDSFLMDETTQNLDDTRADLCQGSTANSLNSSSGLHQQELKKIKTDIEVLNQSAKKYDSDLVNNRQSFKKIDKKMLECENKLETIGAGVVRRSKRHLVFGQTRKK